jgi:hypothetical protein
LRCLLQQTIKADHTILWVDHSDFALLPLEVTNLQAAGLEIRTTDDIDDIKSYTKIIPALDSFPDAFICTADDDLYYWPTWLEELVENTNLKDHVVTCHRGHEITLDSRGDFKPYNEWNWDIQIRGELKRLFPTGIGGVLYPPGILAHTAEDRSAILNLCPDADDIWLYWMGRRNGAIYKTVGRWRKLVLWHGTQEHALWHSNVTQGRNDEQIRMMADRYGYPDCR